MTTLREAAQAALEALEYQCPIYAKATIESLRAALAEPVQPVAWMVYTLDGKSVCVTDNPADFTDEYRVLPLFTAPPQRKPLSTADALRIATEAIGLLQSVGPVQGLVGLVRAVEAAHGIK